MDCGAAIRNLKISKSLDSDLQSAEQAQLFNLVDQACLPRARHEAPLPALTLAFVHLLESAIVRVLS